jgi:hypothetical protein
MRPFSSSEAIPYHSILSEDYEKEKNFRKITSTIISIAITEGILIAGNLQMQANVFVTY